MLSFRKNMEENYNYSSVCPYRSYFAPFVGGMGKMHYYYFMMYNLIGGAFWVAIFCYAGYFFGDLPFVQKKFKF